MTYTENYKLKVVMNGGAIYEHEVHPEFCTHDLRYYADGLRFECEEDYIDYVIGYLHPYTHKYIAYICLSHFDTIIFERGTKPISEEKRYKLEISAVDSQKGKHDTYKIHVNKFVLASEIFEYMRQFTNTFETLGYKVAIAKVYSCGLVAIKQYKPKHYRSFVLAIENI